MAFCVQSLWNRSILSYLSKPSFQKFSSRRRQPWCRLLLRRVIIIVLVRLTINYPFLINKLLGSKPNLLSTQAMYDAGDPQSQIAKYWDMNTVYTGG